jgi:hypothetical protein
MSRVSALVAAILLLSAAARPGATLLLPAEFGELVASSAAVVHGQVVELRAQWVQGRRLIETEVVVDVVEYFKGNLGDRLTFRVPGGVLGSYQTVMVGAPRFEEGDEVVLLLTSRDPLPPVPTGLSQGVFRVRRGHGTAPDVVPPPPIFTGSAGKVVRGSAARRPLSLATFAAEVRRLATSAPGPAARDRRP